MKVKIRYESTRKLLIEPDEFEQGLYNKENVTYLDMPISEFQLLEMIIQQYDYIQNYLNRLRIETDKEVK